MTNFTNLPLIAPIQKAIAEAGYETPTPIQEQAIPEILSGRDILGYAQTGTGKTAAFTLPILQKLEKSNPRQGIKALIVTPTRELAIQIGENIAQYSAYLPVRHTVIFGGVPAKPQISALKQGVQILVATPGRLLDLHNQGHIRLNKLDYFVLDEADRMLDMGFIHDIKRLLQIIPQKRQTLFFSATMPKQIEQLASRMLIKPKTIQIAVKSSTAERVEQKLYYVCKKEKKDLLVHLLKDENMESVLVFTRTKHGADRIARLLNKEKIAAAAIHGNKSQNARQRALTAFKANEIRVLIATDIAARGIDIDSLSHVINYELPNIPETYVHRIGRTGRAGKEGIAISFCDFEERAYLKDIEKLIRQSIYKEYEHPYIDNCKAKPASATQQEKGGRPNRKSATSSRDKKPKRTAGSSDNRSSDRRGSSSKRTQSNDNRSSSQERKSSNRFSAKRH